MATGSQSSKGHQQNSVSRPSTKPKAQEETKGSKGKPTLQQTLVAAGKSGAFTLVDMTHTNAPLGMVTNYKDAALTQPVRGFQEGERVPPITSEAHLPKMPTTLPKPSPTSKEETKKPAQ
jgi:hypothetical protein